MKRSEINGIIREGLAFFESMNFKLPPFAHWSPEDWTGKGPECRDIAEQQLGWDITDFGSGDFAGLGLFLFTIRNGSPEEFRTKTGKGYAEKIMIAQEDQITPRHTHHYKSEDIINRGGGELVIQLWPQVGDKAAEEGEVKVKMDGVLKTIPAGETVVLTPGESITLEPGHFHKFWAAEGKGAVMIGEVSMVNDDHTDNLFDPPIGRFPEIEEDEASFRLLIGDYDKYYKP